MDRPHDYLKRLPPEFYPGQSCVQWSMTVEERSTGCLMPGYPEFSPFQSDFWSLFDRLCCKLRGDGLVAK